MKDREAGCAALHGVAKSQTEQHINNKKIIRAGEGIGFPGGSDGKESTCNAEDMSLIPGLWRAPGRGHGNPLPGLLTGESPWTEEPGGLQSIGSQRVEYDWVTKHSTGEGILKIIVASFFLFFIKMSKRVIFIIWCCWFEKDQELMACYTCIELRTFYILSE